MNKTLIYKGRGNAEMYDDFIDFINYVFGFNGDNQDFVKLLPKLYKPEYNPCENNYVLTENGKLKAAIGVFPREIDVMGERLVTHGVGNVAVHPFSRSKGYMKDLLNAAIRDMIESGADLSELGGHRQRYAYFSYDLASPVYNFNINRSNVRHCFAGIPQRNLNFSEIKEDCELLDKIYELHEKKVCRTIRPRAQFLDIARSWQNKLYAILEDGSFLGYFIGNLNELTLINNADASDVIRTYIAEHGEVKLSLPAYETELIAIAEKICGSMNIGCDENYTIFNFKKVISAFLKLKANVSGLIDGSMNFRVNGIAGVESFRIEVKDGKPLLIGLETSDKVDLTLEHREAVSFFFGIVSPTRTKHQLAAAWFPLPLFMHRADHV
jgi:predicted N-acetyltransferase YhbS